MDTAAVKNLTESLRQISAHVKRLRAADQILQGYVRLNSSGDGIAMAIGELQTAADELARHSRQFAKSVSDLATTVTTTTSTLEERHDG